MMEFGEAVGQGSVGWGSREGFLEKAVDNYHEVDNYEPEEENQSNNDIGESQLTGLQYKLTQENGKYSSGGDGNYRARNDGGAKRNIRRGN